MSRGTLDSNGHPTANDGLTTNEFCLWLAHSCVFPQYIQGYANGVYWIFTIFDLVLKILDFNNEQLRTKKTAKVVRREYQGYPLSHPGLLLGIPQCHFLTRFVPNICCPSRNLHWSSQRNQSTPYQLVVAAHSFQSKIINLKSKMWVINMKSPGNKTKDQFIPTTIRFSTSFVKIVPKMANECRKIYCLQYSSDRKNPCPDEAINA